MLSVLLCSSLVLEVYRITLLSNYQSTLNSVMNVLEVYRITLLSNKFSRLLSISIVLEVYRITLLSNYPIQFSTVFIGFRGLQNYTTLKLYPYIDANGDSFRGLQNYTTLKPLHWL